VSAFLLGAGFRADMGTCIRKLVLLKLIDACEDDGSRIFPAIATVARAAQCSDRQVQREIRAFLEIGLLALVREGGKGRRSTNEYRLDLDVLAAISRHGWDAYAAARGGVEPASEGDDAQGDTVSPLDEGAKGDKSAPLRVTAETAKGDSWSPPTPPDPSPDPSIERERGREDPEDGKPQADRQKIERAFEKAFREWPSSISDSRPAALKAWLALQPEEREKAAGHAARYLDAAKGVGRRIPCSFGVYLSEKRWEGLPPPAEAKPATADAPAFGPVWAAVRMRALLTQEPVEPPTPPSSFIARLIAQDDAAGRAERLRRQANYGWPVVNRLHEAAANRKGFLVTVGSQAERLGPLMEPVPVGSAVWEAWRDEHEKRGWPWVPDPGSMRVVYFPAGGPEGLEAFELALRGENKQAEEGNHDDGARPQEAE